jgi:molybdopterin-binding protein
MNNIHYELLEVKLSPCFNLNVYLLYINTLLFSESEITKFRRLKMKYGARNQIIGTVAGIKKGSLMSQVTVEIPAKSIMSSVMTIDSLADLNLKEGDKVHVIVKAVNVLLVKE